MSTFPHNPVVGRELTDRELVAIYEEAFASMWRLLALVEAGIVDGQAITQLRAEVGKVIFGTGADVDELFSRQVMNLKQSIGTLPHNDSMTEVIIGADNNG